MSLLDKNKKKAEEEAKEFVEAATKKGKKGQKERKKYDDHQVLYR
ncbi:MAG: hypothetical protein ABSB40_11490 [Nitrososphaeria archaeon]|jgi:hypothetical protein